MNRSYVSWWKAASARNYFSFCILQTLFYPIAARKSFVNEGIVLSLVINWKDFKAIKNLRTPPFEAKNSHNRLIPTTTKNLWKTKRDIFWKMGTVKSSVLSKKVYKMFTKHMFPFHVEGEYQQLIFYISSRPFKMWYFIPDSHRTRFTSFAVAEPLASQYMNNCYGGVRQNNVTNNIMLHADLQTKNSFQVKVHKSIQRWYQFLISEHEVHHDGLNTGCKSQKLQILLTNLT